MEVIYLTLAVFLVIPGALLIWCAATEATLMKNRPQLSWLLPAGSMLASALIQKGLDGGSGLNALLWSLPDLYSRCVLSGTAAGAAIGAILRWFGVPGEEVSPV